MSEQTFTPGPWRIGEEYKGARCIYGRSCDPFTDKPLERDTFICAVQEGAWIYEKEANARLIEAAPDLLYALECLTKEVRESVKMNVRKDFSLMNAHAYAGKMILKAKGEL